MPQGLEYRMIYQRPSELAPAPTLPHTLHPSGRFQLDLMPRPHMSLQVILPGPVGRVLAAGNRAFRTRSLSMLGVCMPREVCS